MVGFSVLRQETIEAKYFCIYCTLLLNIPMQLTKCGHHICKSCLEKQKSENAIVCWKCNEKMDRKDVRPDRAFENELQMLLVFCTFCHWNGMLKFYSVHLNEQHSNPICNYCGEKFLFVDGLNEHQQFQCEKMTVECDFKDFGCDEAIRRIDLPKHYQNFKHQKILMEIIPGVKSEDSQVTKLPLQEITSVADALFDGIDVLRGDINQLSTDSDEYKRTIENLTRDFSSLATTVQSQNEIIDQNKANQDTLGQDVKQMKQNVIDTRSVSNDGTFVWKIENVKELLTKLFIFSPEFYSSAFGYKARLQLKLNSTNTAFGLYFSILPGEFDAILKFPFDYQILFCLFDQTDQRNHIIKSFKANFPRPSTTHDKILSNGIEDFAPLNLIFQTNSPYIHDNVMQIKVLIDFLDLPMSIYAHTFNLNQAMSQFFIQKITT